MLVFPDTWTGITFPQFRDELIDTLKNLACLTPQEVLVRASGPYPESAIESDLQFLYNDMHLAPDEFAKWTEGVLLGEAEVAAINALMRAVDAAGGRRDQYMSVHDAFAQPGWPLVSERAQQALDILLERGEAREEPDAVSPPAPRRTSVLQRWFRR